MLAGKYSSMFIIVMNLIFIFSLWCIDWVGSLYANQYFLCISDLELHRDPGLAGRKSVLNPRKWPFEGGGPGVSLILCCFVIYSTLKVCLVLFCSCGFQSLPRLGRREIILVLFVLLFDLRLIGLGWFLFLLVSGKGCGLWLYHTLDFSLNFFP